MQRCLLTAVAILAAACSGRELSPIRLVPMLTLGTDSGDGAMASTPRVSARHPNGFRIVVPAFGTIGSLPLIFDDNGKYLGALHGDSGPTDIIGQPIVARFGPGDSIWVFDNARRMHVFDPSRKFIRTIPISSAPADADLPLIDAIVLPDGRIAASTEAPATVQLFSARGVLERDIGPRESIHHPGGTIRGSDGTLWTFARYGPWQIEQWDTSGKRLKKIEPPPGWFDDPSVAARSRRPTTRTADLPPLPAVSETWFDSAGRLWILGEVADRHWREGIVLSDSNTRQHIEPDKYYDTIVEVRDPKTGQVLATARFDIHCASIAEPGVLVHEIVTKTGWVRAELLRVVFDESAISKKR